MDREELNRAIEESRDSYFKELLPWRQRYLKNGKRSEDGFETLMRLPDCVEWVLEEDLLVMQGREKGLQEMASIIQAFARDEETTGLFYDRFLLLKHHEPMPYGDLIVISMPGEVWLFWGGKMVDVAWGYDTEETSFNSIGFFEETLPVDIGIRLMTDGV